MSEPQKLLELIQRVEAVSPKLINHWQTMAIIESLGYTDRIIKEEFDFADVLEIGQYIYERHTPKSVEPNLVISDNKISLLAELAAFIEQFSRSFVYAIPLLSLLVLGNADTSETWKFIPPQLATVFTLATLASLITSGGFVQAIARRGEFYFGLDLPHQARKACLGLLSLGMLTSFILGIISLWFGFYLSLFPDEYLILGVIYYLFLSLLWMLLSILSLLSVWGTPLTLIGLTAMFWGIKFQFAMGALEAQIMAIVITLVLLAMIVVFLLNRQGKSNPIDHEVELPKLSATVYLLAPFFAYGITYFCFIFADRLVAGWSVNAASGLIFAIDSAYQRAMDLALLNFLLAVPFCEYLAYKIIKYWYQQAKIAKFTDMATLSKHLNRSYLLAIFAVVLFFTLLVAFTVGIPEPQPWAIINPGLTWVGCLGYLLLVLGLLNGVILFNLNTAAVVISTLFPSLIVNLVVGYIAAKVISPEWAVIGLIVGSIVFLILSRNKVLEAINHPDYAYYLGGY